MRKILEQCPSCGGEIVATQLTCTECSTTVIGEFKPCPFCKLPPDDLQFLEVFVMARGNVKEMERALGINYWTIRNRIGELVRKLGYEVDPEEEERIQRHKRDILQALERGEITVAEAESSLAELRQSGPQA